MRKGGLKKTMATCLPCLSHTKLERQHDEAAVQMDEGLLENRDYNRLDKMHKFYLAANNGSKRRQSVTPSVASVIEDAYEEVAEQLQYEPDKAVNRMSIVEKEKMGRRLSSKIGRQSCSGPAQRNSMQCPTNASRSGSIDIIPTGSQPRQKSLTVTKNEMQSIDNIRALYEERRAQLERQIADDNETDNDGTSRNSTESRRSTIMQSPQVNGRRLSVCTIDIIKSDHLGGIKDQKSNRSFDDRNDDNLLSGPVALSPKALSPAPSSEMSSLCRSISRIENLDE